jgi:hypothetical protein
MKKYLQNSIESCHEDCNVILQPIDTYTFSDFKVRNEKEIKKLDIKPTVEEFRIKKLDDFRLLSLIR